MYKEILRSISHIEIFPVVAILIFFIFFVALFVWVMRMDKRHLSHMSQLPLEEDPTGNTSSQNGKATNKDIHLLTM